MLTKANSAKNKTEEAGVKEEIELAVQEIITERYDKETLYNRTRRIYERFCNNNTSSRI